MQQNTRLRDVNVLPETMEDIDRGKCQFQKADTNQSDTVRMRRDINLFYASSILTGVVIGSGIFVSPTSFVRHCGSVGASLALWVVCGIMMLCIALCYVEMGCMFPKAGGEYHYYKTVIGPLPAFLFAWIVLVTSSPSFYALLALTTSEYLLYGAFGTCAPPYSAVVLLSIWIVVTIVIVNSLYVKYVLRFQTFFTTAKVLGLGMIVLLGIIQLANGKTSILKTGFENSSTDPGSYINAIYAGMFTYSGWGKVFLMLEEVKHPERVVPRATIISLLVITGLYTFTNVAYFTVLTPEEMLNSPAVAMTFAEKAIGRYSLIMPVLVACSTIGAINGAIMGGSRVSFAAARDNLLPPLFSSLSLKYHTPWPSLVYSCLITVLYIITGSAVTLIEFVGFVGTLVTCMTITCLLYLRYKEPSKHRPFKVPLWLAILMLLLNFVLFCMSIYFSPLKYGYGVLIMLIGVPVYLFTTAYKTKPKALLRFHERLTVTIQRILLVVPSEKEPNF